MCECVCVVVCGRVRVILSVSMFVCVLYVCVWVVVLAYFVCARGSRIICACIESLQAVT